MDLPVVAFIGEIGAGKTAAGKYVANRYRFHRLPFAAPLKTMLLGLGLSDAQVNGDQKQVSSPLLCGKTPREAMQFLGTEWGRQMIGDDLWVNAWAAEVRRLHVPIVVDDCRFWNEYWTIKKLGGAVIRVHREGLSIPENEHESERQKRLFRADETVLNNGSLPDLFSSVDKALKAVVEKFACESSETTAAE